MYVIAIITGFGGGILSGLIGIGGGIIMVPALVLFMKYSQHLSQGTALTAMLPPIGILAAYEYYKNGYVNLPVAAFISIGFIAGGFLGAKMAIPVNDVLLRKIFGVVLLVISLKMIIGK